MSKSHNESILNYLIRKGRRASSSSNASYLILYAFLYKYMSDRLKRHLLYQFGADGDDLKMFYLTDEGTHDIREIALNDLGYFFESYDAYIDQFVGDKFLGELLDAEFLSLLKENIIFSKDNPCKEYFDEIINTVERQTKFYRLNYDSEQELIISDYLSSIAKLDISENEFPFSKVYDMISSARQIRMIPTPEYITQVLTTTVSATKREAKSVYDPFLRDASILTDISKSLNASHIYAKESDELYYFYSLIKLFINDYDFNDIFFKNENAIESLAFADELFDVVVSKIPNNFRYARKITRKQNLESPNPYKKDIKKQLISQLDLSELGDDEELLKALRIVEQKVEAVEKNNVFNFTGEYASLKDSEFLFVINMINSLKENGLMAISVSQNFLFKKSLTTLRKFLTYENNYIDTIIALPENMGRSVRPEVIIVFRKNRRSDDILFVDMSREGSVPSGNAMPGMGRRNLVFDDESLTRLVEIISKRQPSVKFSDVITLSDLARNDFNLTVSRYVDTYEGEFISLKELSSKRKEIDSKMDELTKKIDLMMDDLNLKP